MLTRNVNTYLKINDGWQTLDDTWSLLKQHKTKAKTQYQNIEFSMDDRDWFDMMVHGHH